MFIILTIFIHIFGRKNSEFSKLEDEKDGPMNDHSNSVEVLDQETMVKIWTEEYENIDLMLFELKIKVFGIYSEYLFIDYKKLLKLIEPNVYKEQIERFYALYEVLMQKLSILELLALASYTKIINYRALDDIDLKIPKYYGKDPNDFFVYRALSNVSIYVFQTEFQQFKIYYENLISTSQTKMAIETLEFYISDLLISWEPYASKQHNDNVLETVTCV